LAVALLQSEEQVLVSRYNARDIGCTGWRRVALRFEQGERLAREFRVTNLWSEDADGLKTLFVLEAPTGLRGMSYLMHELSEPASFAVLIYVPVGKKLVRNLAPDVLHQGLLGSDFTYHDLRWRLPTSDVRYALGGDGTLLDRRVRLLDMFSDSRDAPWQRVRWYLADDLSLMLGADYFAPDSASEAPAKRMRVERIEQNGAVWQPISMVMETTRTRTVIRLEESVLNSRSTQPVTAALMRAIGDRTREGGSPGLRPLD
jgi:hypothetical protein